MSFLVLKWSKEESHRTLTLEEFVLSQVQSILQTNQMHRPRITMTYIVLCENLVTS